MCSSLSISFSNLCLVFIGYYGKYFVLDYDFIKEAMVSDAKIFVISPVSNNSFIESVRLRSIESTLFKLFSLSPNCLAISDNVKRPF